jgi:hypothetical protein
VKSLLEVAVSPFTVTEIFPVVVPVGTLISSWVEEADVTTAVVLLNFTLLFTAVALKFVPVIITVEPIAPEVGEKEVIVGC